ncbi:MAG: hypothetical protein A3E01_19320 [Gammaproteobacteria bacterium RIFCSPHIGHO2_12_FULL_63_22]|nr:MAG: hypothetical protein A3E01_19320 [Gammaproteobacteria bacterium RIFCSPHIGHO2_12_FULL_63_22]
MLDSTLDLPVGTPTAISEAVAQALGKALRAAGDGLPQPPRPETFSRELRNPVYEALGLSESQIDAIEEMVLEAPTRKPGKGALDNLITRVQSRKNGGPRWLESHTVERLFHYSIERNQNVIGYVTQVKCRRVPTGRTGQHVSNPTLDFLVFYKNRIVLVECKTEEALEKLAQKKEDVWKRQGDAWINTAHVGFAKRLGIEAEVYSVGRLFSVELQNAELINAELRSEDADADKSLRRAATAALRDRPLTIEEISELVPGFSIRSAAKMLAEGSAFGLERIISMGDVDTFLLFSAGGHRDVVDAELWSSHLAETAELRISDRILLAKAEHVEIAKKRWDRLQRIARGEEPPTRRMSDLAKLVFAAIASGTSPIEACLSRQDECGNRDRRLVEKQLTALAKVVERWNGGEFPDRFEAWLALGGLCKADGVDVPHESTLNREIRKTDQTRRTLIVDGIRQYQKERARTDGSRCSLPSILFGHTLIIDSSNFDQRIAANILTLFPSSVPRFYAAVDGASGYPMAHALMFGPARTDGLAILMREFVWRHGFLPRCIQLDRGPENTGSWISKFAEHFGIELRWPPTGGSRYNGLAENLIGRVNHFVAHRGPGSTLPDQMGRAKDGRMKSRKTAIKGFEHVVRQFEGYFYSEFASTRVGNDKMSPADLREYLTDLAGEGGIRCEFNDAFRVLTSTEIEVPRTIERSRGIRLVEGTYAGAALNAALRTTHITEIRKDCINPAVVYAKAGGNWYRAFRRDCVPLLSRSGEHKLFKLLCEPIWRSEAAAHNKEQKRVTVERREAEMTEAMFGKEHLTDRLPETKLPEFKELQIEYPTVDWGSSALSAT